MIIRNLNLNKNEYPVMLLTNHLIQFLKKIINVNFIYEKQNQNF